MVPPVAVQLTAVLELPVTVAANCWVLPGCRVVADGDIETCTLGALTVIWAEAVFVGSATEVALTVKLLPAVDPAVKRPLRVTVPPVAVHVTAVLEVPVTVAANWIVLFT